jgi:hypothetical protein
MNALLFETLISLSVQALCMLTHTIGFAPFVVVLFVSVVLLDLRLLLDSDPLAPARHLGVVCLVLWAGWLGYLHLVQSVEPWRALAYSPSVLVVTRLSFKHSSKRRVFTLIMLAEALIMQKTDAPPAALACQGFAFTAFAHVSSTRPALTPQVRPCSTAANTQVLFCRRVSQKEPPSLLWIVISSAWVLMTPWFIALPLALVLGAVIARHASAAFKEDQEEQIRPDVEARGTLDASS